LLPPLHSFLYPPTTAELHSESLHPPTAAESVTGAAVNDT
ncbi:uncharacterized, partial [Tachysurus ichikawai]